MAALALFSPTTSTSAPFRWKSKTTLSNAPIAVASQKSAPLRSMRSWPRTSFISKASINGFDDVKNTWPTTVLSRWPVLSPVESMWRIRPIVHTSRDRVTVPIFGTHGRGYIGKGDAAIGWRERQGSLLRMNRVLRSTTCFVSAQTHARFYKMGPLSLLSRRRTYLSAQRSRVGEDEEESALLRTR